MKYLTKHLSQTVFVLLLVVLLGLLVFNYRLTTELKSGDLQLSNISGNLILNIDGVYDQNRLAKNRLYTNFLNSFSNNQVEIEGKEYVVYRPIPDTIDTKDGRYYFNKDLDRLMLARSVSDFSYIDRVLVLRDGNQFNFSTTSLDSIRANLFAKQIKDTLNCENSQFLQCLGKIDKVTRITELKGNRRIDLKYGVQIANGQDPKSVKIGVNINLPDFFQVCRLGDKTCLAKDWQNNEIASVQDLPVEYYQQGKFVRQVKLSDLQLDEINFYRLELPDLDKKIDKKPDENLSLDQKYVLVARLGNKNIWLKIEPTSKNLESIRYNRKYGNLVFKSTACQDRFCDLDLSIKIDLDQPIDFKYS
jgi:hypothetical protein